MSRNDTTPSKLWEISNDLEQLSVKLSAWNETFGLIMEGLDRDGTAARKVSGYATKFASRFPAYSEMLFLVLDGLQGCEAAVDGLYERLAQEVTV